MVGCWLKHVESTTPLDSGNWALKNVWSQSKAVEAPQIQITWLISAFTLLQATWQKNWSFCCRDFLTYSAFLPQLLFNIIMPQIWADFSLLHWPDTERWSPYVSRSSWCTGNACSATAQSHMQLTKPLANLATAGPLCYHHLCCILFSQWVIFPLRLGKDLSWGQKKAFSRFCLGNYVYVQDFQLLKD